MTYTESRKRRSNVTQEARLGRSLWITLQIERSQAADRDVWPTGRDGWPTVFTRRRGKAWRMTYVPWRLTYA